MEPDAATETAAVSEEWLDLSGDGGVLKQVRWQQVQPVCMGLVCSGRLAWKFDGALSHEVRLWSYSRAGLSPAWLS